jgi:hypothetical protein
MTSLSTVTRSVQGWAVEENEDDGVLLFVGEEELDVGAGGEGAGGVVVVADVVNTGVGIGLDHGLDVVGVIGTERDAGGRGEGAGGAMVRAGGAGRGHDVVFLDAFDGGDGFGECRGFPGGGVAAAERIFTRRREKAELWRSMMALVCWCGCGWGAPENSGGSDRGRKAIPQPTP